MSTCFPILTWRQSRVSHVFHDMEHIGSTKRSDNVEDVPGRLIKGRFGTDRVPPGYSQATDQAEGNDDLTPAYNTSQRIVWGAADRQLERK